MESDVEAGRDEDLSFGIRSNIHLVWKTNDDGRVARKRIELPTRDTYYLHFLWLRSIPQITVTTIIVPDKNDVIEECRKHNESLLTQVYYRSRHITKWQSPREESFLNKQSIFVISMETAYSHIRHYVLHNDYFIKQKQLCIYTECKPNGYDTWIQFLLYI